MKSVIYMAGMFAVGGLLISAGTARADDYYVPAPYWNQIGLTVGGGVSGFTDDAMRNRSSTGGSWDVRAALGTRSALSVEAAYLGSAQSLDTPGLGPDAILLGNGAEADLRFNLVPRMPVQPYLFLGAAWRHYDVTNTDSNFSDIADSDDVGEFPMGAGIAYRMKQFMIDARGQFRPAFDNDLVSANRAGADLHRWGVSANLGFEF